MDFLLELEISYSCYKSVTFELQIERYIQSARVSFCGRPSRQLEASVWGRVRLLLLNLLYNFEVAIAVCDVSLLTAAMRPYIRLLYGCGWSFQRRASLLSNGSKNVNMKCHLLIELANFGLAEFSCQGRGARNVIVELFSFLWPPYYACYSWRLPIRLFCGCGRSFSEVTQHSVRLKVACWF